MTDVTEVVGLPVGGPTTLDLVRDKLQLQATDTEPDTELAGIADAVNYLVRRWPVAAHATDAATWPGHIVEGATMLAVRLWRRKDSPAGVEAFSQLGAAYVMRSDPDIAMLLQLGTWQRPGIG